MPSCRITNHTPHTLNVSLKQVAALHFENEVKPGATIKFKAGKVWFTFEAILDAGPGTESRYSVLKSAATIALISLAIAAVAATAGTALLPESIAIAGGGAVAATLAKGVTLTKAALVSNAGTISRVSAFALPKAVERLTAEIGGLSALQREVLSIISSPTLSVDLRKKTTSILKSLHTAYTHDKANTTTTPPSSTTQSAKIEEIEETSREELAEYELVDEEGKMTESIHTDSPPSPSPSEKPSLASKISSKLPSFTLRRRRESLLSSPKVLTGNVEQGEVEAVMTQGVLRVHGIYMGERRHFSVRERSVDGGVLRMELFDVLKGKVVE